MQAVIMAGGKGTRLAALTKDEIPKPMVPVAGKPLLLWQVERLKENGITDLIMVIGHLGNKIKEYFIKECQTICTGYFVYQHKSRFVHV